MDQADDAISLVRMERYKKLPGNNAFTHGPACKREKRSSSLFYDAVEKVHQMIQFGHLTPDDVPEEQFDEVNSGYTIQEHLGVDTRAEEYRTPWLSTLDPSDRALHEECVSWTREGAVSAISFRFSDHQLGEPRTSGREERKIKNKSKWRLCTRAIPCPHFNYQCGNS